MSFVRFSSLALATALTLTLATEAFAQRRGDSFRRDGRGGGNAHRPPHNPPSHRPPSHRPPVHRPPVHRPPVHRPPVYHPPVYRPPVHRPPVYRPPVYRPPVYHPPVYHPPIYHPPHNPPYYPPHNPPHNPPYNPPYEGEMYCRENGSGYVAYNSSGYAMGAEYAAWRTMDRCESSIANSSYNLICAPTPDRDRFMPVNKNNGQYVGGSHNGFLEREACYRSVQNQVGADVCVKESNGYFRAYDITTLSPSYRNPEAFHELQGCISNLRY